MLDKFELKTVLIFYKETPLLDHSIQVSRYPDFNIIPIVATGTKTYTNEGAALDRAQLLGNLFL